MSPNNFNALDAPTYISRVTNNKFLFLTSIDNTINCVPSLRHGQASVTWNNRHHNLPTPFYKKVL